MKSENINLQSRDLDLILSLETEQKDKEIERLNNIINELEKELELNLKFKVIGVKRLKNKLKELKESGNNE